MEFFKKIMLSFFKTSIHLIAWSIELFGKLVVTLGEGVYKLKK